MTTLRIIIMIAGATFSVALARASSILFIRQFRYVQPLERRQALIMILASLIPWLCIIDYSLWVDGGIYFTAFGISVSAVLFSWGVYRRHLIPPHVPDRP